MPTVRSLVAAAAILVAGAAAAFASTTDRIADTLNHLGPRDFASFAALQIAVAASGVLPASLLAIAAGAAFGVAKGFVLCTVGTMIGGLIAFRLARSFLRPWIVCWIGHRPAFVRLDAAVANGDWKVACLIRLSPVMPFAATSYGLGLTRMSTRSFLLGMIASLPALLGYVSLGAIGKSGATGDFDAGTWLSALTLTVGAAASIGLAAHLRQLICRPAGEQKRPAVPHHEPADFPTVA